MSRSGAPARVAILGAGWVVRHCYLPALAAVGARLAAIHDPEPGLAGALVEAAGSGRVAGGVDDLLASEADLVVVATPNHTHAPLSRRALEAGHRVICEKPLALDRAAVEELLPAGRGRLFVSCPFRFRPDVGALLDVFASGELGEVYRLRLSWTRAQGVPRPGSWYTDRARAGGGVLVDLGSHLLDLALRMAPQEVAGVTAWTSYVHAGSVRHAVPWMAGRADDDGGRADVEDQAAALLLLEGGRAIELQVSWAGYRSYDRTRIEIEGSDGRAVLDTLFGYSTLAPPHPPRLTVISRHGREVREIPFQRRPAADFGAMLCALGSEEQPGVCDLDHALRVVDAVERVYDASRKRPAPHLVARFDGD